VRAYVPYVRSKAYKRRRATQVRHSVSESRRRCRRKKIEAQKKEGRSSEEEATQVRHSVSESKKTLQKKEERGAEERRKKF